MPVAVSTYSVKCVLRPCLGSELVDGTSIAEEAAHVLRSYTSYCDTLQELHERLSNTLFDVLYNTLGPRMTVKLDDGEVRRVKIEELPVMADDLLGLYFDTLQVHAASYQLLKDYSLRASSLNAMRVLYLKFDEFQSRAEKALMARIIRDVYPQERYQAWLKDEA